MFSLTDSSQIQQQIFVLWGERFDEVAATIFACELRRVGLRVKLIGLAGRCSLGMYGMELCADMALGEALTLTLKAACMIVPCSGPTMRRFEHDPRLFRFLKKVCTPQTQLLLKEADVLEPAWIADLPISPENQIIYSAYPDLLALAHHTAQTLAAQSWAS